MNKDLERSHPGFVRVEEAPNVVLDQKHSGVVESKSVNDFIANKNTSNIIPNFFKRRYDDRCNSLVSNNNVFLTSQKLSLEIGDKSHTDCVSSNGSIRAVAPPFQPRGSLLPESSIQSTIRGLHLQFGFEQDLPVAFNMNECGNPTKDLNIDDIKDLNIDDLVFHARHPPKLLRSTASISPLPHHNEIELHKYPPSPFGGVAHPQMGDSPLRQKLSDVRLGPTHSPCLTNIESFVGKDDYIYYVRFKRTTRMHVLHPSAPLNIGVGDFVRVEADRGEDLGVVQTKVHVSEYRPEDPRTAGYRGRGFCSSHHEIKWLYRLATTTERLQIRDKVIEEQEALHVISSKIAQRHLPMEVIDAEYQFDRHKLVFYFSATKRIDFRELVSELFSLYKTRIWMQQVDIAIDGDDSPGTRLAKKVGLLSSFPCEDNVLNGSPWLGYAPQQQQQQHSKDNYTAEAQQLWQDQNLA